jgi:hypothetical protein
MPYGLRGVANNIDPLVNSFQRLTRETGSSTQAIKAMLGGLMGPAGFAIAVSAITSLLVAFGPQIKDFFASFGDGAKDVETAKNELKALEDVAKDIAGDLGLSETEVLGGVKEIVELLESQQTIRDAIAGTIGNSGLVNSEDKDRRREFQSVLKEVNQAISEQSEFARSLDESQRKAILERIDNLTKEAELRRNIRDLIIETNQEWIEERSKELTEQARSSVPIPVDPEFELIEDKLPTLSEITAGLDLSTPGYAGARGVKALTNALQEYGYTLEQINGMSEEQGQLMLQQARNSEYLSNMISGQLVDASVMGLEALGALAVAGDGKELFLNFQTQLAGFMSVFGKQLIAIGAGSLALRNVLTNPAAAIAAGTALVLAAGAIRADAQNRLNNLTGSGSTSNTLTGYRGVQVGSVNNAAGPSFPEKVTVEFTDGTGNIVANGVMQLDRQGRSIYLGG